MAASCSICGYDNPLGSNFCSSCGEPLRAAVDSETERITVTELQSGIEPATVASGNAAVLVVREGPKRGTRIALNSDTISIGRQEDSDIFLDDITVSRNHASLTRVATAFSVVDSGSMNGTYVNKELVEQAELSDGDELQIGKFKLVYLELGAGQ